MQVELLSKKYKVRKLIEKDIPTIFPLCKENKIYYDYCPPMVDEQSIKEDMYALPLNKEIADKYYVGFFDTEELIAVMDLIKKYPDKDTCFIGFFMVDIKKQAKGIGSFIIQEVCEYIKSLNYKYIKLAWIKGNNQAESFWHKNGFIEIDERKDQNNHSVIQAVKYLDIQ